VPATILIVDDEPCIARSLAMGLADAGYRVEQAANGAEALVGVERGRVDLILSDVLMPLVDGHTVVDDLRRRGDRTPVILKSAGHQGIMPTPGVRFVAKPFDLEALLVLARRSLLDAPT
jgi:CheY-like chemotaxis protein